MLIPLKQELIQVLANYLVKRPYDEVAQLLAALTVGVQEGQKLAEKPEEKPAPAAESTA